MCVDPACSCWGAWGVRTHTGERGGKQTTRSKEGRAPTPPPQTATAARLPARHDRRPMRVAGACSTALTQEQEEGVVRHQLRPPYVAHLGRTQAGEEPGQSVHARDQVDGVQQVVALLHVAQQLLRAGEGWDLVRCGGWQARARRQRRWWRLAVAAALPGAVSKGVHRWEALTASTSLCLSKVQGRWRQCPRQPLHPPTPPHHTHLLGAHLVDGAEHPGLEVEVVGSTPLSGQEGQGGKGLRGATCRAVEQEGRGFVCLMLIHLLCAAARARA